MAEDNESIFARAGFDLPTAASGTGMKKGDAKAEPKAGRKMAPPSGSSIFEQAGFDIPGGAKPVASLKPDSVIPDPADRGKYLTPDEPQKSTLQRIHEAIDPSTLIAAGAKNTYHDTLENAVASAALAHRGIADIVDRNYLPSTPGINPSTWSPGGILKTAAGGLGVLASPITGAVNALVARPVTELTGNPEIGDRAGFVANALVPVRGGAKTVETVAPSTKATNALVEMVGPENVPEAVARLRDNPRLTLADVSEPVRTATQGLIDPAQPKVQNLVVQRVKDRTNSRVDATNSAFTEAMGPAPDVGHMVEGLKARAREAGQQAIQPALKNAKPVDVSPVIEAIDKELKPGVHALLDPDTRLPLSDLQQELIRFKQKLTTGTEQAFDPQALHRIQSDMGDQAFQLMKSADPKDRLLGRQLRDYNEKLIDQIDAAAGGAYRPARAKFKDAKDIHEAFDEGFDVLKNRSGQSGFEDRPAALKEWMKGATPEQVVAKRLGVRADIDQKINGVKNGALAGQTITSIPYNQEKLRTLFGDSEANRLIRVMKDAEDEARTNYKLLEGAKTAETLAGRKALEVRDVKSGNPLQYAVPFMSEFLGSQYGIPGVGAGMLGLKGLHLGAQKIGQLSDRARNYEFARNALAAGPVREETINALLAHPKVVGELKKRANALVAP